MVFPRAPPEPCLRHCSCCRKRSLGITLTWWCGIPWGAGLGSPQTVTKGAASIAWDPVSEGLGGMEGIRYFLIFNSFSRVKEKLQQQLGPAVNCERFQQIYPKSFTPESPPSSPSTRVGHNPLPWAFVLLGLIIPGGKRSKKSSLPLSHPPHPSRLRERLPLAEAAVETGPSHGALGFGVYWVTQPLPRGTQGWT